jgi:hypothetical protein
MKRIRGSVKLLGHIRTIEGSRARAFSEINHFYRERGVSTPSYEQILSISTHFNG